MKIVFLLPPLLEGSGGHRTIVQHAWYCEQIGHQVTVAVQEDSNVLDATGLSTLIQELFEFRITDVCFWNDVVLDAYDRVVCTAWFTLSWAIERNVLDKVTYFVQDWEAWFNPVGDSYIGAERSYLAPCSHISIGNFLAVKLLEFGHEAVATPFGIDRDTYFVTDVARRRQVCAIYQPEKPRRLPHTVLETLRTVKTIDPSIEIVLYGSRQRPNVDFEYTWAGLMSPAELRVLYNHSKCGLALSSTNPSRIPFEMAACKLPIVDVLAANTVFDAAGDAHLFSLPVPNALARKIVRVVDDFDEIARSTDTIASSEDETEAFLRGLESGGRVSVRSRTDLPGTVRMRLEKILSGIELFDSVDKHYIKKVQRDVSSLLAWLE